MSTAATLPAAAVRIVSSTDERRGRNGRPTCVWARSRRRLVARTRCSPEPRRSASVWLDRRCRPWSTCPRRGPTRATPSPCCTHQHVDTRQIHRLHVSRYIELCGQRNCSENYSKWHNKFIFLNCNQHFSNFKPGFRVLFEKNCFRIFDLKNRPVFTL